MYKKRSKSGAGFKVNNFIRFANFPRLYLNIFVKYETKNRRVYHKIPVTYVYLLIVVNETLEIYIVQQISKTIKKCKCPSFICKNRELVFSNSLDIRCSTQCVHKVM